jgi:hypothetical protein
MQLTMIIFLFAIVFVAGLIVPECFLAWRDIRNGTLSGYRSCSNGPSSLKPQPMVN